jgi:hypothetical protein
VEASSVDAIKPENLRFSKAGDEARLMFLLIEDVKLNVPSLAEGSVEVKTVLFVFAPIGML